MSAAGGPGSLIILIDRTTFWSGPRISTSTAISYQLRPSTQFSGCIHYLYVILFPQLVPTVVLAVYASCISCSQHCKKSSVRQRRQASPLGLTKQLSPCHGGRRGMGLTAWSTRIGMLTEASRPPSRHMVSSRDGPPSICTKGTSHSVLMFWLKTFKIVIMVDPHGKLNLDLSFVLSN